ncbi:hypothetical protein A3C21_00035 [Candidatus Kaiserbacteria bacterium RIFCSPHIGHO2_02_FULL_59_21]|uniref:DUF86 domain-containing protein n=2 Tax=Candidatus Kaiseribacteriota TaxID=1752734 RepID=A0A0G2B0U7_9BACT|nr:MAG: hypothetical protein UY98_C0010G0010 [Candidatus Kaiserbacteria bacterium GW2011_GWA2_58_9]OGG62506.1 MAG: hypothetical protein A2766_00870 [Candidatus Kaiserbacteria bacterium RIFCSPHIGHO2_01_FULL_58_22]OGG67477.1 MAG: hypothetical protein A3C21_00035 [Candidatus Kaiserbacteria bacterium RIFCSPHIGHO2_02_FULL_59_21]OGG80112.1 MAG: hypothetical protein A2952_03430 [Candidatus Kaiserbacteria bacterium RIFCSPLOWO2_01_FULL_59_34]OGG86903.1 MAG: hypothetical protein A3I47_02820 [Candidatus K
MNEFAKSVLEEKISQCELSLADLKGIRASGGLEYLRANPREYYAACYRFITAIESIFDASQIVLASKGKRATGQDNIAALLAREKIISDDLADRFMRMYGFRNRLVHAYGTLDDAKVAEYLVKHLGDIEELLAVFKSK